MSSKAEQNAQEVKAGHTPGPWHLDVVRREFENFYVRPHNHETGRSTGFLLASVRSEDSEDEIGMFESCGGSGLANARLIAAAPELLEIAREVEKYMKARNVSSFGDLASGSYLSFFKVSAAIAKAEAR